MKDQLGDYSYDEAASFAKQSRGKDEFGYRDEFLQLIKLAESL